MPDGFKIADAFVEIDTKDNTKKPVDQITKRVQDIPDKVIEIDAQDHASKPIIDIGKLTVPDKVIKVTATDTATPVIDKVDSETIDPVTTEIVAQDKATPVIDRVERKKPKPVQVPVEADDNTDAQLDAIGGKMKTWAAGLGIGSIIGGALSEGLSRSDVTKTFQNQMGVTKDIAEKAGDVAGSVFAEGFTNNREMISTAISNLSSDVKGWADMTQEAQGRISSGAVKIAQVYGQDINAVIKASSSMVNNDLAPSFDYAFDLITKGMQNAGSRGDDLLDTLQEYSPHFQQIGLDGADAIGLLTQMLQAGARDTDYAADAIKEFGIRIVEVGGTAEQGFEALGMSASEMADEFAAGGDRARRAFILTIQALQNMENPVDRNTAGVALFGTQWEDTMRKVLPSLDTAKIKMNDVAGATERLVSEMTATEKVQQAWDTLINGIAQGLVGVAEGVRNFLGIGEDSALVKYVQNLNYELNLSKQNTPFLADIARGLTFEYREMGLAAGFTGQEIKKVTDAITTMADTIIGVVNKDISYRQSLQATKSAQAALIEVLKKHKPTSDEAVNAGLALESAQLRQAQAAKEMGLANSKAADDAGRNSDGARAYAAEVVKMAQAANGNGTPALRSMIGGLTDTELAAAKATKTVDGAGNAVIRLPGGKEIKVDAKDNASAPINAIADRDYKAKVDVVIGNINQAVDAVKRALVPFGLRFAAGGPIHGPGTGTSDSIPLMASDGEYMINAEQTAANRDLLDLINNSDGPVMAMAGGGPVGSSAVGPGSVSTSSTTINNYWPLPADIDVVRLAGLVSREMEIQRRTRR
jgi:hypothetical protein